MVLWGTVLGLVAQISVLSVTWCDIDSLVLSQPSLFVSTSTFLSSAIADMQFYFVRLELSPFLVQDYDECSLNVWVDNVAAGNDVGTYMCISWLVSH